MKSFQVRLSDEVYEAVADIAKMRETSIADVIRESLEIYTIGVSYALEGKRLTWEDPATGEKAQVLIPAFAIGQRKNATSRHQRQVVAR
jgi:predicted transcriptional regulator